MVTCRFRHVDRAAPPHQHFRKRTSENDYSPTNQRGRGGSNKRQQKGACRNCGGEGHWARECRKPKQDSANVVADEDWNRSTREFVGHGQGFQMPYLQEKWLVDSASTCLVANEHFKEFFNVVPAAVTITVGGDIACSARRWETCLSQLVMDHSLSKRFALYQGLAQHLERARPRENDGLDAVQ